MTIEPQSFLPQSPPLFLASRSPRRATLLRQIGVHFYAIDVDVDERWHPNEALNDYVTRLSQEKARAASLFLPANAVVLAADTAGICAGERLNKPHDEAHAVAMLQKMSGRTHTVGTAVSISCAGVLDTRVVTSDILFRPLSLKECHNYWASGEPRDKAGGYAIQGLGGVFVERLTGSYSAVVGLPLCETAALLQKFGISCWQPALNLDHP